MIHFTVPQMIKCARRDSCGCSQSSCFHLRVNEKHDRFFLCTASPDKGRCCEHIWGLHNTELCRCKNTHAYQSCLKMQIYSDPSQNTCEPRWNTHVYWRAHTHTQINTSRHRIWIYYSRSKHFITSFLCCRIATLVITNHYPLNSKHWSYWSAWGLKPGIIPTISKTSHESSCDNLYFSRVYYKLGFFNVLERRASVMCTFIMMVESLLQLSQTTADTRTEISKETAVRDAG